MELSKKDIGLVAVVGAGVGLLAQPILSGSIDALAAQAGMGVVALRATIFFGFLILAPLALAVAAFVSRFLPGVYQFAKFAAVGTLNSFVDVGVFNLITLIFGQDPSLVSPVVYAVMKSASFLTATTNSFMWNKFWTFASGKTSAREEAVKFYSIAILGWFINAAIATYVAKGVAAPAFLSADVWARIIAPVVGIICVLFWNFFGYKFFVFKKK